MAKQRSYLLEARGVAHAVKRLRNYLKRPFSCLGSSRILSF
jgi:hypothetical protein